MRAVCDFVSPLQAGVFESPWWESNPHLHVDENQHGALPLSYTDIARGELSPVAGRDYDFPAFFALFRLWSSPSA